MFAVSCCVVFAVGETSPSAKLRRRPNRCCLSLVLCCVFSPSAKVCRSSSPSAKLGRSHCLHIICLVIIRVCSCCPARRYSAAKCCACACVCSCVVYGSLCAV